MTEASITEALAELRLIGRKLSGHSDTIHTHCTRWDADEDPFVQQGGSATHLGSLAQACGDLISRYARIRNRIARSNAEATLTITPDSGPAVTRTVGEWLVWKRECAKDERGLFQGILDKHRAARAEHKRAPKMLGDEQGAPSRMVHPVFVFQEEEMLKRVSALDEIEQRLDGALSLHNARTTIDID